MEKVHFTAPVSANDLRVVLSATTATEHADYGLAYKTQYGETRYVMWLTRSEASRRATALRRRGYKAVAGPMDVTNA
jgi:hypothetical protein